MNFEPHPSLRRTDILADLDDQALRTVAQQGEEIAFAEGDSVCRRGDAGEHFHIVLDGCVQILVGEGRGRRVVKTHGPGGFFGEMSLLTGAEVSADVVAAEQTRLLRLDKSGFQAMLSAHPQVLIRLTTALANHIANTNRQFLERRLAPLTGFARHGDTLRDDATALHVAVSIARQSNRTALLVTLDPNLPDALARLGAPPPESSGDAYDVASPEAIAKHSFRLSDQLHVLPIARASVAPASLHALLLAARERHGAVLLDLGGSAPASLLPELRQCDHIHLLADQVNIPSLTETVDALDLSPAQRPSRLRIALVAAGDRRPRDVLTPVVEATGIKSLALLAPLTLEKLALDEEGLPTRDTDATTARRIDSMAREAIGARIGIAMGSGGAKGFAHIGVMRVLEEIGVPVDLIVGCSMGAIMGAIFATGKDSVEVERMARRLWARKGAFFDWQVPPWANIVKGKKVDKMSQNGFGDLEIIDCPIPYAAMGFDLITGREVIIDEGTLGNASRASGSLPGIMRPVKWKGMYIVDGGVSNKVPVNVLRDWGADLRIAINVAPEVDPSFYDPSHPRKLGPLGRAVGLLHRGLREMYSEPNIFQILGRTYSTSATKATEQHLHLAHINIRPDTSEVGLLDFLKLDEAVEAGMAATRRVEDEIRREVGALLGR